MCMTLQLAHCNDHRSLCLQSWTYSCPYSLRSFLDADFKYAAFEKAKTYIHTTPAYSLHAIEGC